MANGTHPPWDDTGAYGHRVRRHDDPRFDRATSQVVATVPSATALEALAANEQLRPPWLIFYQVVAYDCAGTEELP